MRALALAVLVLVTACGAEASAQRPGRYAADAITVLESPAHGPQLCSFVAESYPPQCSGPDVVGWDWSKVRHESANGTRWGSYRVVGTWDGSRLTLTEPAGEARRPAVQEQRFTSPCPAPEGGWRPSDPAKATQEALQATQQRLEGEPSVGGVWLDQSYLDAIPGYDGSKPEWAEKYANDPTKLVLNVKFTGDLAGREAWIRETWGGPLCVSQARRSEAELRRVQESLGEGYVHTSVDIMREQVTAGVWVATEELRHRLDAEHGAGVVMLEPVLKPVD
ncbi:hypothetical protein ACIBH1_19175 [Nonomuraea sp. NPDC050663]|uniref:hypothetical protein n=1 Tax=Nonomuraea sp. NPDC050663 TaxID=3364370 RepID=UPI00378B5503